MISKSLKNSRPKASNFKSFSQSLEQFFLTVGQNNLSNKVPFPHSLKTHKGCLKYFLKNPNYEYKNFLALWTLKFSQITRTKKHKFTNSDFLSPKKTSCCYAVFVLSKTKSKKSGIFPIFFLSNHLVVFFIEETPVSSSSQRRFALNCSTSHLIKVINQGVMTRKPLEGKT